MKHCSRLRIDRNGDFFCGTTHVCYKHDCGVVDGFKIVLHPKFFEKIPIDVQLTFDF